MPGSTQGTAIVRILISSESWRVTGAWIRCCYIRRYQYNPLHIVQIHSNTHFDDQAGRFILRRTRCRGRRARPVISSESHGVISSESWRAVGGQVRFALDPLLRALTSQYVDDSDLQDRLLRLFQA